MKVILTWKALVSYDLLWFCLEIQKGKERHVCPTCMSSLPALWTHAFSTTGSFQTPTSRLFLHAYEDGTVLCCNPSTNWVQGSSNSVSQWARTTWNHVWSVLSNIQTPQSRHLNQRRIMNVRSWEKWPQELYCRRKQRMEFYCSRHLWG